jgi:hypothetical protein
VRSLRRYDPELARTDECCEPPARGLELPETSVEMGLVMRSLSLSLVSLSNASCAAKIWVQSTRGFG